MNAGTNTELLASTRKAIAGLTEGTFSIPAAQRLYEKVTRYVAFKSGGGDGLNKAQTTLSSLSVRLSEAIGAAKLKALVTRQGAPGSPKLLSIAEPVPASPKPEWIPVAALGLLVLSVLFFLKRGK